MPSAKLRRVVDDGSRFHGQGLTPTRSDVIVWWPDAALKVPCLRKCIWSLGLGVM